AEYWMAELGLPKQIDFIMCSNDAMPKLKGVPLRIILTDVSGGKECTLDTYEAKVVELPDSAFTMPGGYKQASSAESVILGVTPTDILQDILK
ncbi:MAG: hypothetical protein ACRD3W_03785, partial [Terriglobales bacterium]